MASTLNYVPCVVAVLAFLSSYAFIEVAGKSDGCSAELRGREGLIESPFIPTNSGDPTQCEWVIRSDPGTEITLTFSTFDLPSSDSCSGDAVVVRDGPTNSSELLARLCGNEYVPGFLRSSNNTMFVKFRSDGSDVREGFRAQWSNYLDVAQNVSKDHGIIQSPNYPSNYPNFAWNAWRITTQPGTRVAVEFWGFDMQGGDGCTKDYLAIWDGADSTANVLLKLCGQKIPAPIISTGNIIYVEFRSDSIKTNAGFQLEWSTTNAGPPIRTTSNPSKIPDVTNQTVQASNSTIASIDITGLFNATTENEINATTESIVIEGVGNATIADLNVTNQTVLGSSQRPSITTETLPDPSNETLSPNKTSAGSSNQTLSSTGTTLGPGERKTPSPFTNKTSTTGNASTGAPQSPTQGASGQCPGMTTGPSKVSDGKAQQGKDNSLTRRDIIIIVISACLGLIICVIVIAVYRRHRTHHWNHRLPLVLSDMSSASPDQDTIRPGIWDYDDRSSAYINRSMPLEGQDKPPSGLGDAATLEMSPPRLNSFREL